MKIEAGYEKIPGRTAVPVLDVDVSSPSARSIKCKGVIDTGASITMIPPSVVNDLDLQSAGKIMLGGISGAVLSPKYLINMTVGSTVFRGIIAAGSQTEMRMLIGRNVINLWDLHLSGRARSLVLEPWSTNAQDAWDDI